MTETTFEDVQAFYRSVHPNADEDYVAAGEPSVRAIDGSVTFAAHFAPVSSGAIRIGLLHSSASGSHCIALSDDDANEWHPRWSPDGSRLASLSDRGGKVRLWLRDGSGFGRAHCIPLAGVESFAWSPAGNRLLLIAATEAADRAALQGGRKPPPPGDAPGWLPIVEGSPSGPARILYLLSPDGEPRALPIQGHSMWEASWCGEGLLAVIGSTDPTENGWYDAQLLLVDASSGAIVRRFASELTLAQPAASPDGAWLAAIEAVASDRGVTAGQLMMIDVARWSAAAVDTDGVDVSWLQWRDAGRLLFAGLRGIETVIADHDVIGRSNRLIWRSSTKSCGIVAPVAAPYGDHGAVALIEGYQDRPELHLLGEEPPSRWPTRTTAAAALPARCGVADIIHWQGRDGETIDGLLLRPPGPGPFPLVTELHGGPCWAMRPRWMGDIRPDRLLLVSRGYALFLPNYRGSSGRGPAFAAAARGDIGGIDTEDVIAGIDALVASGLADRSRLGLTGASYGGFLACWMPTRDHRFAASVAISPISNWLSQHWTSNVARFDTIFAGGPPSPAGLHRTRSPVLAALASRTPTLLIAGLADRSTPADQAREHHHALLEAGVESTLLLYPGEGHGIRTLPATIDAATRIIRWFETHMPPAGAHPTS